MQLLLKWDVERLEEHPWSHGPGRVTFVTNVKRQSHDEDDVDLRDAQYAMRKRVSTAVGVRVCPQGVLLVRYKKKL